MSKNKIDKKNDKKTKKIVGKNRKKVGRNRKKSRKKSEKIEKKSGKSGIKSKKKIIGRKIVEKRSKNKKHMGRFMEEFPILTNISLFAKNSYF